MNTDWRPRRLQRLRESIDAAGLAGLLVTSLPNVRYLTGFSGSAALLVVTARDVVLLTDFRYAVQGVAEAGAVAQVIVEATSLWTRLWAVLPQLGSLDAVGFESAHLSYATALSVLSNAPRWEWRPTDGVVEALREQKDAGEVAAIREAVRIAEHALSRTASAIRPGLTELGICGILEAHLREAGSEAHPFEPIVASGERAALPHARSSVRAVARGEWLLIDFGAAYHGYCADVTRTFVVGTATEEQRGIYAVVRESNGTASGAVRAGMRGRDADALARDYIQRHGWGEAFGHSLGHGIGLELHEAPRLSRTNEAPLPRDAVVTIEPGIYRPGWGGVRIEDDVYLATEGPEVLTTFTRELLELG